jgi:hypothetical protein
VAAHGCTQERPHKITRVGHMRRSGAQDQDFLTVGRVGLEPTTGGL